jgi:hypothetical protein
VGSSPTALTIEIKDLAVFHRLSCTVFQTAFFDAIANLDEKRHCAGLSWFFVATERRASEEALRIADDRERLILATGRYIGEGFDGARLDTLFLTMPISWKGKLAQYVGRLPRQHDGKTDVLVVDYVDELVPVLARMATKRKAGYRALGYRIE